MMTPYDKLKSLTKAQQFLKPLFSFESLDQIASEISDNESAKRLNNAKIKLFTNINEQENKTLRKSMP